MADYWGLKKTAGQPILHDQPLSKVAFDLAKSERRSGGSLLNWPMSRQQLRLLLKFVVEIDSDMKHDPAKVLSRVEAKTQIEDKSVLSLLLLYLGFTHCYYYSRPELDL